MHAELAALHCADISSGRPTRFCTQLKFSSLAPSPAIHSLSTTRFPPALAILSVAIPFGCRGSIERPCHDKRTCHKNSIFCVSACLPDKVT